MACRDRGPYTYVRARCFATVRLQFERVWGVVPGVYEFRIIAGACLPYILTVSPEWESIGISLTGSLLDYHYIAIHSLVFLIIISDIITFVSIIIIIAIFYSHIQPIIRS